ncbi:MULTISPECIES: hypothetical protein [unclassified Kitasatospora]|uniref:hypothetical protein n=1 Tax=unclassified Kitasatospora TaxID=2633591 RepID=UPI0033C36013
MPKKRPHTTTLAEMMAALPQVQYWYDEGVPSPAGSEEFVDNEGRRWRKIRGPLHRNLAKRLATQADELIIGEGAGGHFRHVPSGDRLAAWHEIKHRLNAGETPSYHPYEFASTDGLTLLYIEESC